MSLAGVRQGIVDALNDADFTAFLTPPNVLAPGNCWPRLGPLEREQVSGQMLITWRVLYLLPTDEATALDATETVVPGLMDALESVGYVTTITPVIYDAGSPGAKFPALELLLIRE